MNITELKTYSPDTYAAPRMKRPPLSLFRRSSVDARAREIARAAAIEVLG